MDSDTKARRRAGRMLRHRVAQLRKTADELDAVAAEIEGAPEQPDEGMEVEQ